MFDEVAFNFDTGIGIWANLDVNPAICVSENLVVGKFDALVEIDAPKIDPRRLRNLGNTIIGDCVVPNPRRDVIRAGAGPDMNGIGGIELNGVANNARG